MGYTSQVIFWVEKPAVSRLLTMTSQNKEAFDLLFNDADVIKHPSGGMRFDIGTIKWYHDYQDIKAIEELMTLLEDLDEDDHFGFHRLGEEFGDHEQRGGSNLYYCFPSQILECE